MKFEYFIKDVRISKQSTEFSVSSATRNRVIDIKYNVKITFEKSDALMIFIITNQLIDRI